ncbi:MAG: MurT ligase domain-containing protein [Acidimicrobiales bacterium]
MDRPLRTRAAALAGRSVAWASRRVGAGGGSVIGGRVTLALDPGALAALAGGHRSAMVTGTNGKTTTTRLLAAGLSPAGPVTSNTAGANLLAGLVGALYDRPGAGSAALEVDEGLLAEAMAAVRPETVVLLNLSRDQLDRIGEVRLHAASWRRALAASPGTAVVANNDDPLVTWAARGSDRVIWVGTGQRWQADAAACPECGSRIEWGSKAGVADGADGTSGWSCSACDLARPAPALWLEGTRSNDAGVWAGLAELVSSDGLRLPVRLRLPGRCNLANAAMAAAAARSLGVDPAAALAAMEGVETVGGRYAVVAVEGDAGQPVAVRLLLAKNPAGWAEALDLLRPAPLPVVVGINARTADGRDPSWLWDVPFERLAGRRVVATGDRGRDLAVRLHYADVDHTYVRGYREAVRAAGGPEVDLAANYTSFQDARKALGG